jgi:hypothetical protein
VESKCYIAARKVHIFLPQMPVSKAAHQCKISKSRRETPKRLHDHETRPCHPPSVPQYEHHSRHMCRLKIGMHAAMQQTDRQQLKQQHKSRLHVKREGVGHGWSPQQHANGTSSFCMQQLKADKLFNPCRSTYGAFPPVFTEVPRAALPCL